MDAGGARPILGPADEPFYGRATLSRDGFGRCDLVSTRVAPLLGTSTRRHLYSGPLAGSCLPMVKGTK